MLFMVSILLPGAYTNTYTLLKARKLLDSVYEIIRRGGGRKPPHVLTTDSHVLEYSEKYSSTLILCFMHIHSFCVLVFFPFISLIARKLFTTISGWLLRSKWKSFLELLEQFVLIGIFCGIHSRSTVLIIIFVFIFFCFISFSSVDKDKQIINFTFESFRHSSSSKRLELVNAVEDCLASVQLFDEARSMCSLEVSCLVSILVSFYKKSFLTRPFFAAYFALLMIRLFTRSNGNRYCYSLLI